MRGDTLVEIGYKQTFLGKQNETTELKIKVILSKHLYHIFEYVCVIADFNKQTLDEFIYFLQN